MKAYVIVSSNGHAVFATLSVDLAGRKLAEIALESLTDGTCVLPGSGCTVQLCEFGDIADTTAVHARQAASLDAIAAGFLAAMNTHLKHGQPAEAASLVHAYTALLAAGAK